MITNETENIKENRMANVQSEHLVFVAFNSRISAVDRDSGNIVWDWKSPKGKGFVSLMLDGDRLIASIQGYTYCLDPHSGGQIWNQEFKGFGYGHTSLVSTRSLSDRGPAVATTVAEQAAAAAQSSGITH
jgi:outer membrane protein assembly factor BamB